MRWPRPRFTVRQFLVAVAVGALGFWSIKTFRLHQEYERAAVVHREKQNYLDLELKNMIRFPADFAGASSPARRLELLASARARAERIRQQVEYHSHMKVKYEQAASRPWDSVEPDLAEPH